MQEQSLKVLNKDARESAEQIDWVI